MKYTYKTSGTCSTEINFEIENEMVRNVEFTKGCAGNKAGISSLVEGMNVNEVIKRLKGTTCRNETSCPDQLAKALEQAISQK